MARFAPAAAAAASLLLLCAAQVRERVLKRSFCDFNVEELLIFWHRHLSVATAICLSCLAPAPRVARSDLSPLPLLASRCKAASLCADLAFESKWRGDAAGNEHASRGLKKIVVPEVDLGRHDLRSIFFPSTSRPARSRARSARILFCFSQVH